MSKELEIVQLEKPDDAAWTAIGSGISRYNAQQGGEEHGKQLCLVIYGPDQEIVAGLIGSTYWNWCHIDLLWVKDELRGQRLGHRLLEAAEAEARQRGARNVYLDTFGFQAPDFYKARGYVVFGELPDFPAGHTRYFMTKQL